MPTVQSYAEVRFTPDAVRLRKFMAHASPQHMIRAGLSAACAVQSGMGSLDSSNMDPQSAYMTITRLQAQLQVRMLA